MKKFLKLSFVILVLITILLPITYSFAIENINKTEKEKSFFEISQLEISKNEKVEMTIYFEKINYDNFEFTLKSSSNMENVEISNYIADVELEKNFNEITIEIDKSKTNVNQITLYYQIPETAQVNDIIKFIATVTNTEKNGKTEDTSIENTIIEENIEAENNTITTTVSELEKQTIEVQVKIIEKNNENNEQEENRKEDDNKKNDEKMQDRKDNENEEDKEFSKQIVSTNNQKGSNTVTYNGSDNNYLSTLSVDDYALNKEFSKDNSTYFITVGSDVTSLDINATAEESSAIIYIYGNENLEEGTNKVLISVTAENKNVRNYRIYVTKNV